MLGRVCFALLMMCVLTLSACFDRSNESEATKTPALGALEVRTQIVKTESLAVPVKAFGTIAAKQRSAIGALAEGPVERIFVSVGDRVTWVGRRSSGSGRSRITFGGCRKRRSRSRPRLCPVT